MPPRRSARLAAAEKRTSSVLPPLPPALVLAIMALLPPDARGRASCVNRAWRAAADAPEAWTTLDLRPFAALGTDAYVRLLRGAAAKARGRLVSLDVRGIPAALNAVLRSVVAANGGTIQELWVGSVWCVLDSDDVTALLTNAPALRALHADVLTDAVAAALLLSEPRLRLRYLGVDFPLEPTAGTGLYARGRRDAAARAA